MLSVMTEYAHSVNIDVIGSILVGYAKKIVDKALRGETLSDWEIGFLLMETTRRILEIRLNVIEKRIGSLEEILKTRIEALEKELLSTERRIDSVEKELSAKIDSLLMRIDLIEKRILKIEEELKRRDQEKSHS